MRILSLYLLRYIIRVLPQYHFLLYIRTLSFRLRSQSSIRTGFYYLENWPFCHSVLNHLGVEIFGRVEICAIFVHRSTTSSSLMIMHWIIPSKFYCQKYFRPKLLSSDKWFQHPCLILTKWLFINFLVRGFQLSSVVLLVMYNFRWGATAGKYN